MLQNSSETQHFITKALGWGQYLAELVAAQKINDNADLPVYGIVTDATLWQVGQLVGDAFTRNRTNFSLDNLPILFSAVDSVFKATKTCLFSLRSNITPHEV